MIEIDNIYNMDCIEGMKLMANGSVDAVIADLPYGVLNRSNKAVHWDRQIPLEALWEQYRRITKPGSPVILFAQGIFSARLMLSQPRMWRYNLVWRKDRSAGISSSDDAVSTGTEKSWTAQDGRFHEPLLR